ncbi:C40 family peptidase [Superficieibacter sp.]|uniref:C40 family peptidase n=1 Tax=Superficieibacter sp. TaxID=2303322 RepID=UPI0028A6D8D1|nr:C40 family peptidase [Superficieibacter sp.]
MLKLNKYSTMPRVNHFQAVAIILMCSTWPLKVTASSHPKNVAHKSAISLKKAHTVYKSLSYAAQQRRYNRALLLAQEKVKRSHATPVIKGDAQDKAAVRAQNRIYIEQHPEWFATPYRPHHLQDGSGFAGNEHLRTVTEQIITRLQHQLGKQYVWGGESPEEGFDCSGLVFFAYNKLLAAKLPRTANEMFHFRRARNVADNDLQRGDLLFFHIHTRNKADHVGVYLGDGRFIESPRTGERIRISSLNDDFWQEHYLGSKRILTDNTVL